MRDLPLHIYFNSNLNCLLSRESLLILTRRLFYTHGLLSLLYYVSRITHKYEPSSNTSYHVLMTIIYALDTGLHTLQLFTAFRASELLQFTVAALDRVSYILQFLPHLSCGSTGLAKAASSTLKLRHVG
jgi:hypothetical protein